jgi:hypothetical protein
MIQKMQGSQFNWSRWRAGSIAELGIRCRYEHIIANKRTLQKYAVGYCDGTQVLCRQKPDRMAVMFFKDGLLFWNHITTREFSECFGMF